MNVIRVIVQIDDEHVAKIREIAKLLGESGLHVERTMEILGTISGAVDSERVLPRLRRIEGVEAIELDKTFRALEAR